MNDLDPKIWENKTLGAAVNSVFLDQVEAQAQEERDAKAEGRAPREVTCPNRFPSNVNDNVPSTVSDLVYEDAPKPVTTKPKADGK